METVQIHRHVAVLHTANKMLLNIFTCMVNRGVCSDMIFMSTSNFGYVHQVFKIQPFFSDCLNLEEGTNWSSQNIIITTNLCLITSQKSKDLSHWKVIQIKIFWVITPRTVFQRNTLPLSSV